MFKIRTAIPRAVLFAGFVTAYATAGTACYAFAIPGSSQVVAATSSINSPNNHGAVGPNQKAPTQDESLIQKQLVKVVITSSRPEVTRNSAWGLKADITNVAQHAMTLFASEVQLTMEPEATNGGNTHAYQSFLPNTAKAPNTGCSADKDGRPVDCKDLTSPASDEQIVLQPGEHYMFFWDGRDVVTEVNCYPWRHCFWNKLQETLNFVPGPYSFVISGKLHLNDTKEATEQGGNDPYHTFAEAALVKISLPQLSILIWAGIGALLGYMLVSFDEGGDFGRIRAPSGWREGKAVWEFLKGWGRVGRGALAAFLTGAILSIVANRLSDTQFPVKVSVNDVWGSITVGFVFFFIGNKVIDKLKALMPKQAGSQQGAGTVQGSNQQGTAQQGVGTAQDSNPQAAAQPGNV